MATVIGTIYLQIKQDENNNLVARQANYNETTGKWEFSEAWTLLTPSEQAQATNIIRSLKQRLEDE